MEIKRNNFANFCIITCLSGLSLIFIELTIKKTENLYGFSNSFYSMLAFIGVFFLMKKTRNILVTSKDKRLFVVTTILATVFSFFMVAGKNMLLQNTVHIGEIRTWVKIVCGIPLFSSCLILFFSRMPYLNEQLQIYFLEKDFEISERKYYIVCWLLLFAAWLPGLIASYPGIYGYDSVYQLSYYVSGHISLHHPLIHTYLLGFCVWTLGYLFGDLKLGLLVYSVVQMLILSASFSALCLFLRRMKIAQSFRVAVLLLLMFLPTNAIMSFSATKDIIYTAFFLLSILILARISQEPSNLKKYKLILILILVLFFHNIFRSQGIYITIVTLIIALILLKGYKKKVTIIFLISLFIFSIYSGPITRLCKGEKFDSIHEMMCVPCTQIARVAVLDETDLSNSEKSLIDKYIPEYERYFRNEGIADAVKNTFNSKQFKKDPKEFLQLYIKLGLKKPGIYFDAFARLTIGYWYPDMNYRDPSAYHPYWEYNSTEKRASNPEWVIVSDNKPFALKWLHNWYYKLTYFNTYQKVPLFSMLFSSALPTWFLMIFIGWCVYFKKYRYLLPAAMAMALLLTLLLGPVVLYRYIYPLTVVVPIWFGIMLSPKNYEIEKKRKQIWTK
jgi:hypothetical protein